MGNLKLKLIGYWHNLLDVNWPDPAWFIDKHWDTLTKQRVIAHLKFGQKIPYIYCGGSWCRFRCGTTLTGNSELTDGKYIWPEDLPHYLEFHDVRLPQSIVDDFLSNTAPKKNIDFSNLEIDSQWWRKQKGWNYSLKTYKNLLDIGLISVKQFKKGNDDEQKKLLNAFLTEAQGVKGKLSSIDKILSGIETVIQGRFNNYELFAKRANEVGLFTNFTELTFEQYEADKH